MGVDIRGVLIVGFPVNKEELYRYEDNPDITCAHGHKPEKPGQGFCPEDGTKFAFQPRLVISDALKALVAADDNTWLPLPKDEDELDEWWSDLNCEDSFLHDIEGQLYIGADVGYTESHRFSGEGAEIPKDRLDKVYDKVLAFRTAMGSTFKDRDIRFHLYLAFS